MALTLGLLKAYHAIIGLVVSCTLILQPPTGILQHKHYKVHQSRSIFAHVHIWLGRSLILLGAINGGFGLQLANNSTPGLIAYSVIAGLVFLAYIGAVLVTGSRKRRAGGVQNGVSKRNGHHANGHGSGVHG